MKSIITSFWILAMFAFVFSCNKDDKDVKSNSEKHVSIDGFITDDQGVYLDNVLVEFGNASTTTNEFGYFQFPISKYNDFAYIKASKSGYFSGSRTLFLEKLNTANVRISLLPKIFSKSFQSSVSSSVDIGTVKLDFPANAIVRENGQIYNGVVNVAVQYLNSANFSIRNIMPGNLVGLNANNEMQGLGSYGMAAIELQSASGEKLQIKENAEVDLKIEIPEKLRANAPASIPLWYFDETIGLWKEEGFAINNGNRYEGKVKHFSFWNCDDFFPVVHLRGRVIDYSGDPVVITNVTLTIVSNGLRGFDYTNRDGIFEGLVPENEMMILDITDECGNIIDSKNIGPFSTDTDLGDLQIIFISSHLSSIEGSVVDCNYQALKYAVVVISVDNISYSLQTDQGGNFEGILTFCENNPITITAYDIKSLKQSIPVVYNLPGPLLIPPIQVCDDTIQSDDYLSLLLSDGTTQIFLNKSNLNVVIDNSHDITARTVDSVNNFVFDLSLDLSPKLATEIPILTVFYIANDTLYYTKPIPNTGGVLEYTKVANNKGDYYEGHFQARTLTKENISTGEPYGTVTFMNGNFRIKRKQ
jgi:hypothetical protein